MIKRFTIILGLILLYPVTAFCSGNAFDYDGDGVTDDVDCAASDPTVSQLEGNCRSTATNASENTGGDNGTSCRPDAVEIPGNNIDEDCDGLDELG